MHGLSMRRLRKGHALTPKHNSPVNRGGIPNVRRPHNRGRLLTAFVFTITASSASMRTPRACSSAMRLRGASRANAGMSASPASCNRLMRLTTRCGPTGDVTTTTLGTRCRSAWAVHPVPSKRLVSRCHMLSRRAHSLGATSRPPRALSTMMGHVPQRVGHDECPVGSRAFER
jgi:hypothetical protein